MFGCKEAPAPWQIQKLFPGQTEEEIAELAADFFNSISKLFKPVAAARPEHKKNAPELFEIAAALKNCKKPKSNVRGDIDRRLVSKFHDIIAIPLGIIYGQVYDTLEWPRIWSTETVHLIPKNSCPDGLKQLRNLSCTPLFSKVLESFLLRSLKDSTKLAPNQYGGLKGSGVDHFLVDSWNDILSPLEDNRASINLLSIDFEKAFNRMDHNECILALRKLGASEPDLELVSCFLRGRTMQVKIGSSFSSPRTVPGGSPQGSILGNYLFCATTDVFNRMEPEENADADPVHIAEPEPEIPPEEETEAQNNSEEYDSDRGEGHNFRFFRPRRPAAFLDETEISFRCTQEEIDRELGVPEGWRNEKMKIRAYIDDLNIIELRQRGSFLREKTAIQGPYISV